MQRFFSFLSRLRNTRSLRNRLIFLCTSVCLFSFGCQWLFTSNYIYSRMLDQYSAAAHESIEYASSSIGSYLSDVRSWNNVVTENLGLLNLLNQRSSNKISSRKHLDNTIQNIFNHHDEIQRLVFWTAYDEQRTRISRGFDTYSCNTSTLEALSSRYSFSPEKLAKSRFLIEPCTLSEGAIFPSMCLNVIWGIYGDNGKPLAILIAEIDFSAIDRFFFAASPAQKDILLMVDQQDRLIYYRTTIDGVDPTQADIRGLTQGEELLSSYRETLFQGHRYILFSSYPFAQGHKVLRLIPYQRFASAIYGSRTTTIVAFVVSVILTLLAISGGVFRMTRPIDKLGDAMLRMGKGDWGTMLPTDGVDAELLPLIEHFNEMSTLIKNLVQEKYQMVIEQQKVELHALQAQINPHFLYNTLQMVNGQALKHNAYEITTTVNALGDMLRYCVQKEGSPAVLSDEVENIKHYLVIQKMRFLSRLSFSIVVDEALCDMPIPRMTLQPLVENCIVHGMNDGAELFIEISAHLKDGLAEIEVRNAGGTPIERKNLLRLQEYLFDGTPEMNGHVGLKNCYLRLKYFYGDSTRFELSSSKEAGTCVHISIKRGEEDKR